ncbi:General secretion pathway protein D [Olavius sp. associated proteobacterium Delta 1]|nr:General secretion pathway protein D [Olavius sp. associated proteobacterium Delta 1]
MKATHVTVKYIFVALATLLIVAITAHLCVAQTTANSGKAKKSEQFVSIDFNNVDINVFIKFMSELTETNFVVDQRVKGKVTIISPSKISLNEAYKVFESVLEVHGFTTVQSGEVVKIIPSPDARSKSIETKLREESSAPEDKIVTQLIPLRYADPVEIKRLFTPMVSKSSVILAYPPTNTMIITDVYSNIKRLLKILKEIDITGIGQQISVIPVEYAEATKLVNLLTTVFKPTRKKGKAATQKTLTMVADERTNTIVMLTSEVDSLRIKRLITMIDKETPRGKGSIHVYYCKHATAEELAKVLQDLPTQQTGAKAPKAKAASVVAGKVRISADKATNSLIIMADKEDYNVLVDVIQKLDIPRSMVYIESLIMEVDMSTSFNIGIDWSAFGETSINGNDAVVGGGFRNGFVTPGELLQGGLTVGLISEPLKIAGFDVSNISAIINAVKTDDDFRILSTPQILTTDNEEARITVGENRPFQTRSTTDVSGGTFESFEYRDVGKILKITPHVTEDRLVRMQINLEVTAIDQQATLTTSSTLPVTLKRTVDTTVIIKDQQTVVIGGLIDDTTTESESKVPVLGDIPLLGWLFRKQAEETIKTNLYVFLTPRVIKNPGEASGIFRQKKEQLDTIKGGEIKYYDKHSEESEESITITEPIREPRGTEPREIEPR